MIACVRSFSIDCGHRVYGHESKCANLHGHTYRVDVHAQPGTLRGRLVQNPPPEEELDGLGRVIDFSVLKERIGAWLDEHWDHGFIAAEHDAEAREALAALASKLYVLPYNPTAENMARHLLLVICPALMNDTGVVVTRVVVQETPNCRAEVAL